jgi:hypothetical protein
MPLTCVQRRHPFREQQLSADLRRGYDLPLLHKTIEQRLLTLPNDMSINSKQPACERGANIHRGRTAFTAHLLI